MICFFDNTGPYALVNSPCQELAEASVMGCWAQLGGNKHVNKPGPSAKGLLGSAQSHFLFIRRTFEKTLAHER